MPIEQLLPLIMIIIGVLMLLAEAATPGNFLIVPASVLVILGLLGLIAPEVLFSWYSPVLALVILIPMTYVTIKLYQRLAPPAPPQTVVATSLIGRTGVVTSAVSPNTLRGKVQIENDDWSATADKCIPVGRRIKVVSSEGVHVHVDEIAGDGKTMSEEKCT
jgi:inner membrane protein